MRRVVFTLLPFPSLGLFCALFSCVFLEAPTAYANGRFPQSNQIAFHPRDPLTIYARTTFGLLVTHDGGNEWRWICEASVGGVRPSEDPPIGVTGDGHILVSLFGGQKVGTPDGCEFDYAAPDFVHVFTIDNAVDASNPDRAYVVTSAGGAVPMNQPWRTDDDGAHWTPLGTPIPTVLFETIDVAKSDPMRVYMTGAIPPAGVGLPRMPFVYRSIDGGQHFDTYPYALGAHDENIYIAGIDPTNASRIYVRVAGDLTTTPISPDRLVISDDGGMSFHDVIDFPNMFGFAQSDDGQTVWVGSPAMGLFRSDDRGEHFTNVNSLLQVHCLAARGSEIWTCGNDFTDFFVVGVSHDGGMTFDPSVRLKTIAGAVDCPLCTTSAQCQCTWCVIETMFEPMSGCRPPTDFCAMFPDAGGAPGVPAACMTDASTVDAGGVVGRAGCCGVSGARPNSFLSLTLLSLLIAPRRRRV